MRIVKFVLALMTTLNVTFVSCQNLNKDYLDSYPIVEDEIINIGSYINGNVQIMSKDEAIKYVYNEDSTKLYCNDLIYDGVTEEIYGTTKEEYIPSKCFRINYDDFFLIAYTSFECDLKGVANVQLCHLVIYDKMYAPQDTLIIYYDDGYDYSISGYYNSLNCKLYLYDSTKIKSVKSFLYKINQSTLKFEEIRRYDGDINVPLEKQIEALGWGDLFYSDDCE